MNVNVQIERIVLEGVSVQYHQQPLLQEAVRTELRHLLITNGLGNDLLKGGAVSHISTGAIQLTDKNNPTHLGQEIARALHERLSR